MDSAGIANIVREYSQIFINNSQINANIQINGQTAGIACQILDGVTISINNSVITGKLISNDITSGLIVGSHSD